MTGWRPGVFIGYLMGETMFARLESFVSSAMLGGHLVPLFLYLHFSYKCKREFMIKGEIIHR